MNLKLFNHEFIVEDVRKIESNGKVLLFTVRLDTNIFTLDDWMAVHEMLCESRCEIENNLFNVNFKVLLGGINFNHNILKDEIRKLISFDFCIEIGKFFDEDLFISEIQKTKFRFNKI